MKHGWAAPTRESASNPSRAGLFHYLFYGHARGIPKSLFPCLDADGKPAPYSVPDTNTCATGPNPDLHKPSSASGISDLPGGGALITLGLWDEFVGKPFVQASTTLHELGHNLELFHGGAGPVWGTASTPTYFEPNCKPNYLSVMNYLFQARGLVDDAGNLYADYSGDQYPDLDESGLSDGSLPDSPPLPHVLVRPSRGGHARLCARDVAGQAGTARACRSQRALLTSTRIDGISATEPVDWNADGYANGGAQDVNFDGIDSTGGRPLRGFSDWTGMRLDQIGAGFNAFGKGDGILKAEGGGISTTADGDPPLRGWRHPQARGGRHTGRRRRHPQARGGGILTIEDGGILRLEGGGILKYKGGGILRYEGGGIFKQEGGGILKLEGGGILRLEGGGTEGIQDGGILKYEGGGILQYEGGGILRLEGRRARTHLRHREGHGIHAAEHLEGVRDWRQLRRAGSDGTTSPHQPQVEVAERRDGDFVCRVPLGGRQCLRHQYQGRRRIRDDVRQIQRSCRTECSSPTSSPRPSTTARRAGRRTPRRSSR